MNIELIHRPGNAAAVATFSARERLVCEGGAMLAMTDGLQVETTTRKRGGSVTAGLKRMLAGESFFLNHFTASRDGCRLWLAPALMGDMEALQLNGGKLIISGGSFAAHTEGVEIDLGWQGFKSLLSGESLFWIEARGSGQILVNTFGCIYSVDVNGSFIVDSGHIVAFENSLDFSITKAGTSWVSSFLGGEGLVCRFEGSGRLWCQSHSPAGFGGLLGPLLKQR